MQAPGAIVNNAADMREMRANFNGGRIDTVAAGSIEFNRYTGEYVEVNDRLVPIPTTGIALSVASNLIDSDGSDAGAPGSPSTFYCVYLSNDVATDFPQELRLSSTSPTDSNTSGQRYLNTTGNGANWRLVGYVYLDSGGNFVDNEAQRYVVNEANRIPRRLRLTPGYNNNNALTAVAFVSANFGRINAGTGDTVGWCDNGRDIAVWLSAHFAITLTPAAATYWGIGIDSNTAASVCAIVAAGAVNVSVGASIFVPPASPALRTATMLAATGAGATWLADAGRSGSAADVPATYLEGWILA